MWVFYAFGSALFAGLTSILAKCGIRRTDSTVATAIRTVVVLLVSWGMVFLVGAQGTITDLSARTWLFLILSGLATCASWLCYFRALQLGEVNKVVPVDKSSTVLTILLAVLFLGEPMTPLTAVCIALIAAGTYLMIERKRPQSAGPIGDKEAVPRAEQPAAEPEPAAAAGPIAASTGADTAARADLRRSAAIRASADAADPNAAAGKPAPRAADGRWLLYAVLSAVFAALTSILGKIGIEGVESNLGTAIRTGVVLVMAWTMVLAAGKRAEVAKTPRGELGMICLSGLATGASWLCYYRALQTGPASVVVPIDKLSIVVTVLFARIVFGERLTKRAALGLLLIVAGTLGMLLPLP